MTHPAGATTVLADSHPLWLDVIEGVAGAEGAVVVGRATTVDVATRLVARHGPDLVVVGIDTSGEFDHDFVRFVRGRCPATKLIVLGEAVDVAAVGSALGAGATAYVVKAAQPDDLALAIRQSFSTSIFFNSLHGGVSTRGPAPVGESTSAVATIGLTKRELEILRLVSEGYSNSQLARMLWVTEQTVKFHLSNIYRKLGVSNRTEASRWAQRNGLLASSGARIAAA
jgi:DNA-binding NarL/FixJ family response regulator